MGRKSTMSVEQRAKLVLRLLSKEEPAVQIARRAGVSEQTLYRWREEFLRGGQQALGGRGAEAEQAKVVERLSGELAERDQVIGELTIANRVLKKTLGGSS
jgi:transposase